MKTLPSSTHWGLLGLLWLFSAASLVQPPDSGPGPSISGRHYSLRSQLRPCLALHPHQYPVFYFKYRVPKIKTKQYSFSTLVFYVATLFLLRAWITHKYNLPQGKLSLPSRSIFRTLLFFTLLFNYFIVVEAIPTRQQAVHII